MYHLLPWLLEWETPAQTARSSSCNASVPCWDHPAKKILCQAWAKSREPKWLGVGRAVQKRTHRSCSAHLFAEVGGMMRPRCLLCAFRELLDTAANCPCACHPPPSPHCVLSNLLWAGRPDKTQALNGFVLQFSKCPRLIISMEPRHSAWGKTPGPAG